MMTLKSYRNYVITISYWRIFIPSLTYCETCGRRRIDVRHSSKFAT